jgi:transcriptional regulator with XRE-family HTH domain
MATLKERLLEERTKADLSQVNLAKEVGITWRAYQRYEAGERMPTIPILVAIADYYGVSTDYLLGRTDTPN